MENQYQGLIHSRISSVKINRNTQCNLFYFGNIFFSILIGSYTCMAKNTLGETISREARMTVRQNSLNEPKRPQFVQIPAGHVFFDEDSDFVIMHCVASGVPQPEISWSFNDQLIRDNTERLHIFDNGTLQIHNPIEEDEGNYRCEAKNYVGSISTVANYKINGKINVCLSK